MLTLTSIQNPPLGTMGELVDGIAADLDAEQVSEAFVLGQSYGGAVAQVLVQRIMMKVRLVALLSNTPMHLLD